MAKNTAKVEETLTINIPQLVIDKLQIKLVGDSPLICHAWDEKAKKMMLDKQMKKAKGAREAKDPEAQFHASLFDAIDAVGMKKVKGVGV